jgi:hypothetical protein
VAYNELNQTKFENSTHRISIMSDGGLVVTKGGEDKMVDSSSWIDTKKYGSAIVIVVLIVIVASIAYYKNADGFASPDGVVSRRSQRQIRSDTEVDRSWNLKELERSVSLINRKAGK